MCCVGVARRDGAAHCGLARLPSHRPPLVFRLGQHGADGQGGSLAPSPFVVVVIIVSIIFTALDSARWKNKIASEIARINRGMKQQ